MALHNFTVQANSNDLETQLSALATDCLSSKVLDMQPDAAIDGLAARLNLQLPRILSIPVNIGLFVIVIWNQIKAFCRGAEVYGVLTILHPEPRNPNECQPIYPTCAVHPNPRQTENNH